MIVVTVKGCLPSFRGPHQAAMSAYSKPSESDSELSDSEGEDDDEMQRAISPFLHRMETMLHEANAVDLIFLSEASPELSVCKSYVSNEREVGYVDCCGGEWDASTPEMIGTYTPWNRFLQSL